MHMEEAGNVSSDPSMKQKGQPHGWDYDKDTDRLAMPAAGEHKQIDAWETTDWQ